MPTVVFSGRFKSLAKISKFVKKHAKAAGLDDADIYAVELAVDEACSNIIEHAYQGEGVGKIECACNVSANGLTITLRDNGKAFEMDQVPQPDINRPLQHRTKGGLGVFLIRKMMDDVQYSSTPEKGNVLVIRKQKASG